ncbi:MAG: trypsin-like peptidase domain-containing protein [Clostridia bacterium]|nr:trypsin-like peptidase domain-containing protein [Clostridia bacterium]
MGFSRCSGCGYFLDPSADRCPCCGTPVAGKAAVKQATSSIVKENGVDIYSENIKSVLQIICINSETDGGSGTGFLISADGLALTNTHVISKNGKPYKNITAVANGTRVSCKVIKMGDDKDGHGNGVDCALIQLDSFPIGAKPVKIGNSDNIKNGERIYYIGNSLGEGLCITSGIISDRSRKTAYDRYPLIMTDAATNPGNSGGPMFNEKGEVIGLHVSARINAVGMKYAIPINVVVDCLKIKV